MVVNRAKDRISTRAFAIDDDDDANPVADKKDKQDKIGNHSVHSDDDAHTSTPPADDTARFTSSLW